MNEKRSVGRPKGEFPAREAEVTFFLNTEDAKFLDGYAKGLRFRSRSQFVTTILERLLEGGFAPVVFLKLGLMLGKRADKYGRRKGAGIYNPFRPLLPLPDPEDPAPEEIKQALHQIEAELTQQRV
jgi:hypothetical protein